MENKNLIEAITKLVLKEVISYNNTNKIPISVSARHVHLSKEHLEDLFGQGYVLNKMKDISQPGQFACHEKVTLVGPKNQIENVRILGPTRSETQIEISASDARKLGIEPVVRSSGDIASTPGIKIIGPKCSIILDKGCMISERHIHMTTKDAKRYDVVDKEKVSVKIDSIKGGVLDNVYIRVSDNYALDMHIDVDDSNAFLISGNENIQIIKNNGGK